MRIIASNSFSLSQCSVQQKRKIFIDEKCIHFCSLLSQRSYIEVKNFKLLDSYVAFVSADTLALFGRILGFSHLSRLSFIIILKDKYTSESHNICEANPTLGKRILKQCFMFSSFVLRAKPDTWVTVLFRTTFKVRKICCLF